MKQYWDKDFYSIEEYSGRKYIHIHGYFYNNSDSVDIKSLKETSRQLDYVGLLISLDDFLKCDRDDYYIATGECPQTTGIMRPFTAVWIMNHYYDGAPPKELPYIELTLDTPCGHYVDDGVEFDWR